MIYILSGLCCDKYLYAGMGMLYSHTTSDRCTSMKNLPLLPSSHPVSSLVGVEVEWSSHPASRPRRTGYPSAFEANL